MSLAERKQIAQQRAHLLSTHMQYSKHIGVQRLKSTCEYTSNGWTTYKTRGPQTKKNKLIKERA